VTIWRLGPHAPAGPRHGEKSMQVANDAPVPACMEGITHPDCGKANRHCSRQDARTCLRCPFESQRLPASRRWKAICAVTERHQCFSQASLQSVSLHSRSQYFEIYRRFMQTCRHYNFHMSRRIFSRFPECKVALRGAPTARRRGATNSMTACCIYFSSNFRNGEIQLCSSVSRSK
jgi:hypothetical protein